MKHSYDNIAFIYDRLARLVYGRALVHAQQYLVAAIPAGAHVLIIGGGTGWVLEEITKLHPTGLNITYVDSSVKMIDLARKRDAGNNALQFIAAPVETMGASAQYDVVLTPFLFDNFKDNKMQEVFFLLHAQLRPAGIWLHCDFQNTNKLWQQAMLKIMYVFFRTFCGIEAAALPDVEACYRKYHYKVRDRKTFLDGFVAATVYIKPDLPGN